MLEAFALGVGVVATSMAVLLLLSLAANVADALTKAEKEEKDNAA